MCLICYKKQPHPINRAARNFISERIYPFKLRLTIFFGFDSFFMEIIRGGNCSRLLHFKTRGKNERPLKNEVCKAPAFI